ncbi:serine/threonine protein kinase [Streptomyces sp. NPDC056244]|uniref:serine/threonine protein kinase n=1 Tax=Streptomyces sp. NPDC056244 TaxID=3345762 RepID=UPI0035DB526E
MDDYAGRVLADRYRLPLPPSDEYELVETRAFDTYSGQEVLVRQVPLPEVVEAEVVDADGAAVPRRVPGRAPRRASDPAVRRAIEAAQSAAQIPDHPRLDQVFDVFADGGSLWIVSELVAARPLAALLAEKPLNPFRAAEIASDVLTAVRVVHAHGWTHRNITVRTVLVCDDGRVVLTGLAAGAAEEALCGYAPVPEPPGSDGPAPGAGSGPGLDSGQGTGGTEQLGQRERFGPSDGLPGPGTQDATRALGYDPGPTAGVPGAPGRPALGTGHGPESPYGDGTSSGTSGAMPRPHTGTPGIPAPYDGRPALPGGTASGDIRAARAGAIAAYRAGARAAARASEDQRGPAVPPLPEPGADGSAGTQGTQGPQEPPHGGSPDPDWWAQPRAFEEPDTDEDDEPPTPYRAQLAGTWRDGPNPWNDALGSIPAGGSPYGPNSPGPFVSGTSGVPAQGGGTASGQDRPDAPRTTGLPAAGDRWDSPPSTQEERHPAATGGDAHALPPGADGSAAALGGPAPAPSGDSPYGPGHGPGPADARALPPGEVPGPRAAEGSWGTTPSGDPYGAGRPTPSPAGSGGGTPRADVVVARGGETPYSGPGSGGWAPGGSSDALRADARRDARLPAVAGPGAGAGRWDEVVASGAVPAYRGPATPLAAERARQARIAVVGAVTERWAPEQAGPVHENWQLAPPIGPATDLWALGALLYRAVQGHAPYPEESAIELVQLVCAEPPAFAEECGPLRPVVESLLRQDPTERPDFEELRGWLRSLIRSAPEPEAGQDVVPIPADETKLPIKRRRGELVRKRWGRKGDAGRHRHKKGKEPRKDKGAVGGLDEQRQYQPEPQPEPHYQQPHAHPQPHAHLRSHEPEESYDRLEGMMDRRPAGGSGRSGGGGRGPRSLGRVLLVLILLLVVGAIVFAVMFMPKADTGGQGQSVGEATPGASSAPQPPGDGDPDRTPSDAAPSDSDDSAPPASGPTVELAEGYALRDDSEGFRIGVDKDWQRRPINDSGQVRYVGGDFTLIVVPGRDSVAENGADPVAYQRDKERELQPFRDSSWATASGVRRIDVGRQAMAEGQYTWQDSSGRDVFVRNLAMIVDGRYHIIQVIGPDSQRDKVDEIYQQATSAYRVTG